MSTSGASGPAGEAPRNQIRPPATPHYRIFNAHDGYSVFSAVHRSSNVARHPFGIQLYTLVALREPPLEIALRLADLVSGWKQTILPRVDIYLRRMNSIEQCMRHQRQEKQYRNKKSVGGGLPIVPVWWESRLAYRNWILVIGKDCNDWESVLEKGLTSVQFDWCGDSEDEFAAYEDECEEEPELMFVEHTPPGPSPPMHQVVLIHQAVVVDPVAAAAQQDQLGDEEWLTLPLKDRLHDDKHKGLGELYNDIIGRLSQCCDVSGRPRDKFTFVDLWGKWDGQAAYHYVDDHDMEDNNENNGEDEWATIHWSGDHEDLGS
ncbi:hypothetical protein B0H66DRAFT_624444 [Apodospora peruviana]|uniref:Uncharacterized protein n=1 Tax=Apodospora peruviana TaxID=516989 RepID=A0AAE0M1H1_9PEZI|nr:hypothetical protein B0H66DRAFT_624444 [Apodospora peruviana]